MKPDPKSPYAVSKLTGEQYCAVFGEVYGLKTVCLRYFNVYDQSKILLQNMPLLYQGL
jgi:nucleoside-diphosphate-sugar epimerase